MADLPGGTYSVPLPTAGKPHVSQLEARRSRFLAQAFRAPDTAAAKAGIEAIKRRYRDATHNCWAFVAGPPGDAAHIGSSDDGEPAGTAGRPILNVLLHSGIGEIAMVVTRWFGGIKLGTGNLARAYQDCASENLRGLALEFFVPSCRGRVSLPYALFDTFKRLLAARGAKVISENYGERVDLEITAPLEAAAEIEFEITQKSGGKAAVEFFL